MDDNIKSDIDRENKKLNKTRKTLIVAIVIVVASAGGWFVAKSLQNDSSEPENETVSYLTNNRDIVCVTDGVEKLLCENVQTDEVKTFELPKQSGLGGGYLQSPDGTKMIVDTAERSFIVVDQDFKQEVDLSEILKFENRDELRDYAWAGNDKIVVQEVKYEENDTKENPAPLVISIIDINTKDVKTVYKTGEQVDTESIELIGADNEDLYISLGAAKNWVADDVDPPADIVNAISLSDGSVRQVGTYQIDFNSEDEKTYWGNRYFFDADKKLFYIAGEARADDVPDSLFLVAGIAENDYGTVLNKLLELPTGSLFSGYPTFSSKGLVLKGENDESNTTYAVVNDKFEIKELSIKVEYTQLNMHSGTFEMSFETMPNLNEI